MPITRQLQDKLCRACRVSLRRMLTTQQQTGPPASPFERAALKWDFERGPNHDPDSATSSIRAEMRSRSFIFDEPIDWSSKTIKRQKIRQAAFNERWRAEWTSEEILEKEKWEADPWWLLTEDTISRSPIRRCIITQQKLPSGLMVNFRKVLVDVKPISGQPQAYILPDRVEHVKSTPKKLGKGLWVICRKDSISRLDDPGPHARYTKERGAEVLGDLHELVYSQLCNRIIQELEIMVKRLRPTVLKRSRSRSAQSEGSDDLTQPVSLRRVGMEEMDRIQEGRYDGENAIAIIDLEGLHTEMAPEERQSAEVSGSGGQAYPSRPGEEIEENGQAVQIPSVEQWRTIRTPKTIIPVYTLAEMLPEDKAKTARDLMEEILAIESSKTRKFRHSTTSLTRGINQERQGEDASKQDVGGGGRAEEPEILILSSYARSEGYQNSGDVGKDLAIALWRLRLFLGEGWEEMNVDVKGRKI